MIRVDLIKATEPSSDYSPEERAAILAEHARIQGEDIEDDRDEAVADSGRE